MPCENTLLKGHEEKEIFALGLFKSRIQHGTSNLLSELEDTTFCSLAGGKHWLLFVQGAEHKYFIYTFMTSAAILLLVAFRCES